MIRLYEKPQNVKMNLVIASNFMVLDSNAWSNLIVMTIGMFERLMKRGSTGAES